MQKLLIYFSMAAALIIGGCSIHQPAVQQGNVLDPEALAQLKPGLSKRQVKFILGDPVLADPFHADRWDYVKKQKPKTKHPTQKRHTLYFDNDVVSRMEGAGGDLPATTPQEGRYSRVTSARAPPPRAGLPCAARCLRTYLGSANKPR